LGESRRWLRLGAILTLETAIVIAVVESEMWFFGSTGKRIKLHSLPFSNRPFDRFYAANSPARRQGGFAPEIACGAIC